VGYDGFLFENGVTLIYDMAKKIRIKDIAKKAGVSTGTVDRVLHNRGNVSAKSREKVERVMQELDYEPNIIASTLAYNRVTTIAALLPNPVVDTYWSYPLKGVQKAAKTYQHYGVDIQSHFFDHGDPKKFLSVATPILNDPPDALLFPPLFQQESEQLLAEASAMGLVISFINTDLEGQAVLSYVGQDSYQSGVLAGRLLSIVSSQIKKVLVLHLDQEITNAKHLQDKERGVEAYFKKEARNHATIISTHFSAYSNPGQMREFFMDLRSKHPDLSGVFVTNSRSYKLINALSDQDLDGIPIVGFDLLPENLAYLKEQKISFLINQNPAQQGFLGVTNIVDKLIFKKDIARIQHLPLDIVVTENASYYIDREYQFVV
jgi:LacI family transcriptional regulator